MRGTVEQNGGAFALCGREVWDGDRANLIVPANFPAPESFRPGAFRIDKAILRFCTDDGLDMDPAGRLFERPGPADFRRQRNPWVARSFGRI